MVIRPLREISLPLARDYGHKRNYNACSLYRYILLYVRSGVNLEKLILKFDSKLEPQTMAYDLPEFTH